MNHLNVLAKVALAALVVVCVAHTVNAIKCWDCRSDEDPKCGDPFDNKTYSMFDCDEHEGLSHLKGLRPTMCRKIRQKVHGEWRYFRSCAFMGEPGIEGDERFCLMRAGSYNIFMEYCTCNSKDGCNAGSHLHGHINSFTVTAATIFVSAIAWMLRT